MSKFPFFSMQQLNLDWLMKQMQRILAFLPIDSGHAGQILQRGSQSARWVNIGAVSMDIHGLETAETVTGSDELPVYNTSVEGNRKMTISALAAMLPSPAAPVTSVNGKTGAVVLDAEDVGALPDSYTAPVTSVNGMTGDVIVSGGGGGAVDSVNGKTGNVILTASDVGAMPDSYTAPVQSVNGQTGNVSLGAADVGALPDTYTAPVTSVNGQTGNVVISASPINFIGGTEIELTKSDVLSFPSNIPSSAVDFLFVRIKLSADKKYALVCGQGGYTPSSTSYGTSSFSFDISSQLADVQIPSQWQSRYLSQVFVGGALMTDGAEISLRLAPSRILYIDHYYPDSSGVNRWRFPPTLIQLY